MSNPTSITIESSAPGPKHNRPYINVSAASDLLDSGPLGAAVTQAAVPGLAALHAQVNSLGRVTGNLSNAVAMWVQPDAGENKAFAEIGFLHEGGQHAHLVEYGTKPRARTTSAVFSSWNSKRVGRGKWTGAPVYPRNFISAKPVVAASPARYPLQKAMNKSRAQMAGILYSELEKTGTAAIESAAKDLQGSKPWYLQ
jgi:hypothetical protein